MLYISCETIAEILAHTADLIAEDEYDFIVCYNGNYDAVMHRYGPESPEAPTLVQPHWAKHDSLVAFAMDHGCHEIHGGCGSHGLDIPEDISSRHLYKAYPARQPSVLIRPFHPKGRIFYCNFSG